MVKARGKKGFFRRFQVVVVLVNWISYNIASDTETCCTFYSDIETTINIVALPKTPECFYHNRFEYYRKWATLKNTEDHTSFFSSFA